MNNVSNNVSSNAGINVSNNISNEELNKSITIINSLSQYYQSKIVGQLNLQKSLLIALMSNGHVLLESVPGLAKTTAAKVMTDAVGGFFSRIQCTPDLLPGDIIGTQTFNYQKNVFETRIGPISANFVLLDEINRSSSKTQSAMLEAMQERQVSIGGTKYKLPNVFVVIATQNPIEQEGTYLLSEAQLDRFFIKEKLEYPTTDEEVEILNRIENNVFLNNNKILSIEDLEFLQNITKKVYIDNSIKRYITNIIYCTRFPSKVLPENFSKYIEVGSSTRGTIAFMECAKAHALLCGRTYVIPEDIKELSYQILRHRITLTYEAMADGVKVETLINEIIKVVKTP